MYNGTSVNGTAVVSVFTTTAPPWTSFFHRLGVDYVCRYVPLAFQWYHVHISYIYVYRNVSQFLAFMRYCALSVNYWSIYFTHPAVVALLEGRAADETGLTEAGGGL